jgi:hypothetical protein
MSTRNFKDIQKADDHLVLYFSTPASQWGETVSITMPLAESQKLLRKLQETLHASGKPLH